MGEIIGEGVRRHRRYFRERSICPIAVSKGGPVQEGVLHFSDLKKMVKKPSHKTRTAALWISDATWRLADPRAALVRTHNVNQQMRRT